MIPKTTKEGVLIQTDKNIKRNLDTTVQTYKGYIIEPIEHGFFEATNTKGPNVLKDTTIVGLLKQINER